MVGLRVYDLGFRVVKGPFPFQGPTLARVYGLGALGFRGS